MYTHSHWDHVFGGVAGVTYHVEGHHEAVSTRAEIEAIIAEPRDLH